MSAQTVHITLSDQGGPDLKVDMRFVPPLSKGDRSGPAYGVTVEIINLLSRLAHEAKSKVEIAAPDAVMAIGETEVAE